MTEESLVATIFITEGWAYEGQYPYTKLKIKALLNNHSKIKIILE